MPPTDALRQALEASLKETPDDLATHMAYADHLVELGDPRGELAQVQLALEDESRPAGERERLRQREQNLLQAHQAEWLGEAAPLFLLGQNELDASRAFGLSYRYGREHNTFRFGRGWLEELRLAGFTTPLAEALGRSPTIGLLQRLTIATADEDDPGYDTLTGWPCLGALRRFQLGPDDDQCHLSGDSIGSAIAQMSRLEELYLYAHRVPVDEVFGLLLPRLRLLRAYHLYHYHLDVLADNASLANLTTLVCWPHALEPDDDQAYIQPEDFRALIRSPHLTSLTYLALYLTDIGDAEMQALVESGLLRQLRVLDLWNSRIGDEGARLLAACPDLPRLEKLRLSQNQLTSAGIAVLRDTGVNLEANNQHSGVAIAENQHLWEGDME